LLLSVRLSVGPSVRRVPIANNSRTQRPSVSKFGRKVPHLRCDSHTSFKVKRSKIRVRGGREHNVSPEPGGHTACCFVQLSVLASSCLLSFLAASVLASASPWLVASVGSCRGCCCRQLYSPRGQAFASRSLEVKFYGLGLEGPGLGLGLEF